MIRNSTVMPQTLYTQSCVDVWKQQATLCVYSVLLLKLTLFNVYLLRMRENQGAGLLIGDQMFCFSAPVKWV